MLFHGILVAAQCLGIATSFTPVNPLGLGSTDQVIEGVGDGAVAHLAIFAADAPPAVVKLPAVGQ